jgi:hypothetical protein
MAQLPPARLVPKDRSDQAVVARAVVGRGMRRGAGMVWQLIKLAVIGVLLVAVVGLLLHVLQRWGEPADPVVDWPPQRGGGPVWVVQ